ncbi:MAG: hypothetical protein OEQ13_12505, partial [Acidobacteriota bacterium]|nr:hypothetical protein [Acidobacteriota bacterium]
MAHSGVMGLRIRLIAALLAVAIVPPLILAWRAGPILAGFRQDISGTIRVGAREIVDEWFTAHADIATDAVSGWTDALSGLRRSPERLLDGKRASGLTRRQERAIEGIQAASVLSGLDAGSVFWVPSSPPDATMKPLHAWPTSQDSPDNTEMRVPPGATSWFWSDADDSLHVVSARGWGVPERPDASLLLTGEIHHPLSHVAERLAIAVSAPVTISRWLPGRDYGDAALFAVDEDGRVHDLDAVPTERAIVAVVDVDLSAVGREETRQLRAALLWALLAGMAVAVAFALISAQLLALPIRRLTAAVSLVADGEPALGSMPAGPGEAGRLASAVDRMLAALRREHGRRIDAERRAAWRDIARRVAHEVRNPLSPIRLAVDNLKRAKARHPERLADDLDTEADAILQEVRRLDRLVREFSEFARLPSPEPRPVSPGELVHAAMRGQIPDAERISCEIEIDPEADRPIPLDRDLMSQAVANLTRNAVEAIGDRPGRIRAELRAVGRSDVAGAARIVMEIA